MIHKEYDFDIIHEVGEDMDRLRTRQEKILWKDKLEQENHPVDNEHDLFLEQGGNSLMLDQEII